MRIRVNLTTTLYAVIAIIGIYSLFLSCKQNINAQVAHCETTEAVNMALYQGKNSLSEAHLLSNELSKILHPN